MNNLIYKTKYIAIIFSCLFLSFFSITTGETKNLSNAWDISDDTAIEAGFDDDIYFDSIVPVIIKTVLSLLGVIFMILMVYGGSIWMTAGGKEDRVKKAKDLIQAAIIGLVIVVSAYAISIFVISKITKGVLVD